MDSLTLSASALAVLTLANKLYSTVSRLSKSATPNNRIKTQRISLRTELVILKLRLKNCRLSGTPIEEHAEVQELMSDFRKQAVEADKVLNTYSFGQDAFESTMKKVTSRFRHESGGYEELNKMILLLEKLNKALQTIARPLPPGYDYATAQRVLDVPTTQSSSQRQLAIWMNESLVEGLQSSILSSPQDVDAQEEQHNLYSLWGACCSAFTTMSEYGLHNYEEIKQCRDRLRLWGTGLFANGELHLERLLGQSQTLSQKLAEPLALRLGEIALEQLRIIDTILSCYTERDTTRLKDASIQLKIVLLAMDMTQSILEDLFYVALSEVSGEDIQQTTIEARVKYLQSIVEILFSYLPGINRLRRSRCLALENSEDQQRIASAAPTSHGFETMSQHSIDAYNSSSAGITPQKNLHDTIDPNLTDVRNLERDMQSRDLTSKPYAALLTKERQRLQDFDHNRAMNLIRDSNGEDEVLSFILVPRPLSDASTSDGKRALMTEEQIKDAVECLRSRNTHLYDATA